MSPLVGKALRQSAAGLRATALTVAAVSLGASALLAALGESPRLFFEAVGTSLGTGFGLGYSLFYATPLLLTGLAVAVPFRCGLFNIGAEGQLYLGAAAAVAVAVAFPSLPGIVGIPLAILAAMIAGGSLGAFAGYCKVKRGSHEVITTILLNFLAIAFVNWLILYPLRNPTSQAPESREIGANFMVPSLHDLLAPLGIKFFESTPANASLLFAIVAAVLVHFFLFRERERCRDGGQFAIEKHRVDLPSVLQVGQVALGETCLEFDEADDGTAGPHHVASDSHDASGVFREVALHAPATDTQPANRVFRYEGDTITHSLWQSRREQTPVDGKQAHRSARFYRRKAIGIWHPHADGADDRRKLRQGLGLRDHVAVGGVELRNDGVTLGKRAAGEQFAGVFVVEPHRVEAHEDRGHDDDGQKVERERRPQRTRAGAQRTQKGPQFFPQRLHRNTYRQRETNA